MLVKFTYDFSRPLIFRDIDHGPRDSLFVKNAAPQKIMFVNMDVSLTVFIYIDLWTAADFCRKRALL